MNVLITGGTGFIGSHLAERFLCDGWHVTLLDDLSNSSLDNIRRLQSNPRLRFVRGCVSNTEIVEELVESSDVVFHLAASVGVRRVLQNPLETIANNIHGSETLLAAAAACRVRTIVASSSEVYGSNTALPFREDSPVSIGVPTKPRWSYACAKLLEEFIAMSYYNSHRLPVTVVRFFNTVGPGQSGRYGMVLPNFAAQAVNGIPITVYGDGCQRRCFCFVGDTVEALVRIAASERAFGEIVNVGNDEEITIGGLAALIRGRTGNRSAIVHIPYSQAYGHGFEDVERRVPCLRKLELLSGYRPSTSLAAIVDAVLAHATAPIARPAHTCQ